jgi:hypothetical protein
MLHHHSYLFFASLTTAIKYGCWSKASNKFDADCLLAYTSLIAENLSHRDDQVYLPSIIESYTVGDCTAYIRGSNYRLPIAPLLDAGDMLTARCQNGFFHLDDRSIEANVQGRAAGKRSLDDGASSSLRENFSDVVYNWTSPEPVFAKLESETRLNLFARSSGTLVKRPAPPGPIVGTAFSAALGGLRIIRSSTGSYRLSNLHWHASMIFSYVLDMLRNAAGDPGFTSQRAGATIMADGAQSLALVMQLGGTHDAWTTLFGASQDVNGVLSRLWGSALSDWADHQFLASVYHVVDEHDDVVVTYILNAVAGVLDPLPS